MIDIQNNKQPATLPLSYKEIILTSKIMDAIFAQINEAQP